MAAAELAAASQLTFTIIFDEPFWIGLFELVEGDRFGAPNGYAAQALGQESRHPAGFGSPVTSPVASR